MDFADDYMVESEKQNLSIQFLKFQKNQLIDLLDHFKRCCKLLPVFGFSSAKYDFSLIKSHLIPILVNERDIELTALKKANHFVSFKFGDIQTVDITNFPGVATSLNSFLKAYTINETKGFLPYEWFDCAEKLSNKELPPYDSFSNILSKITLLERDYSDFENLVRSGLSREQSVAKLRMDNVPPTGAGNYAYSKNIWDEEHLQSFADFLNWYSNKNFVPTMELMQKMIEVFHNEGLKC